MNYGTNETFISANNSYGAFPESISKLELKINKIKRPKFGNTGTINKLMFVSPN